MRRWALFKVLLQMSFLNLRSHKGKTLIVGSILFFGTMLWTLGSSLVGSVERSMAKTVVDSISGHLQIYEADTRDSLALFGGETFGAPDIGEIPRFQDVLDAVKDVSNVRSVVPMGTTVALLSNPSLLDKALAELRSAVREGDPAQPIERVKYLTEYLLKETETRVQGQTMTPEVSKNIGELRYALAATFWADFERKPLEKLEYLDTKIAPLGAEGTMVFMRVLGTDLERYRDTFANFQIVGGEPIPNGGRGFMVSELFLEKYLKNLVARQLDEMQIKVEDGKTFAGDVALGDLASRNAKQYKRILLALDPAHQEEVRDALRDELAMPEQDLDSLLKAFLAVDDANFARRYRFFYDVIAPHADLYPMVVGETVTLQAFTRSGYMRSVNLKVFGKFQFRGMEDSDLAGAYNIIDMMTFRELYGSMSAEQRAELADLKASVGIEEVSREDAEAALFGGEPIVIEDRAAAERMDNDFVVDASRPTGEEGYTQADIDSGLALHAAVYLANPAQIGETRAALSAALEQAGLNMRVVDWQEATGMVGQLTLAMRAVLIFGMLIIFLVALVVVNNTVIISVMERINEIGTMRAIGAQRRFVLVMFLLENMAIAVIAGLVGALAGAGAVSLLGIWGIPAFTRNINFLFGGPRLFPTVGLQDMLGGLAIILVVSAAATYLPARSATRVQPVEAMRDTN